MPTPEHRRHFAQRLEEVRDLLAKAGAGSEERSALEDLAAAYEALLSDFERIDLIRARLREE